MDKQRILVVDDHEPLLTAIQGILEEEDYAVFTATDGTEALNMMEEVYPSLVIADIMMPRMDGYALYEAIRARSEWVAIPFIFLTAKAEREDKLKGKSLPRMRNSITSSGKLPMSWVTNCAPPLPMCVATPNWPWKKSLLPMLSRISFLG